MRKTNDTKRCGRNAMLTAGALAMCATWATGTATAQFADGPVRATGDGGIVIDVPFVRVRTGPRGTVVDAPFTHVEAGVFRPPYAFRGPRPVRPANAVPVRVYVESSAEVVIPPRRAPVNDDAAGGAVPVELGAPTSSPTPDLGAPAPTLTAPTLTEPTLTPPPLPSSNDGEETIIKQHKARKPVPVGPSLGQPATGNQRERQSSDSGDAALARRAAVSSSGSETSGSETSGSRVAVASHEASVESSVDAVAEAPAYLRISAPRKNARPFRMGPIARGESAPAGTTEYELRPMWHGEVPAYFEPGAGTHLFAFIHPATHRTVAVEVPLPAGKPRIEIAADEVEFDYGSYEVEIHFLADGRVRVDRER